MEQATLPFTALSDSSSSLSQFDFPVAFPDNALDPIHGRRSILDGKNGFSVARN